jgi:hypothetical protein
VRSRSSRISSAIIFGREVVPQQKRLCRALGRAGASAFFILSQSGEPRETNRCLGGREDSAARDRNAKPRQRVAVPPERQFRRPAKTQSKVSALRMSDMKKIKTKLVTFVTDNVLLVGIFGNEIFLRMLQERSGKAQR